MSSVGNSNATLATSDVFVTGAGGVAALDTPQQSQTKLEIRHLVAEIAELSSAQIPQTEFINAVLPRICTAMGATAAALWYCHTDDSLEVLGQYRLPENLFPSADASRVDWQQHSLNHQEILRCVTGEGAPILVPPNSIRITAQRPANPLDECLLIVPIKIDQRYDLLLEVIQPPSGGPAAQRGYLRFVAQMADLVSDFVRKARLREYSQRARYVETLEQFLIDITTAADDQGKLESTSSALCRLLEADLAIVASDEHRLGWHVGYRVRAVSDLESFDSRSEIVLAAQRVLNAHRKLKWPSERHFILVASDHLSSDLPEEEQLCANADPSEQLTKPKLAGSAGEQLRQLLGCQHVGMLRLDRLGRRIAMLALGPSSDLKMVQKRAEGLSLSVEALLHTRSRAGWLSDTWSVVLRPVGHRKVLGIAQRDSFLRWGKRLGIALFLTALVCLPVSDHIAAVGVLESIDKELYYAPSSATIDSIFVDTHQPVKKGEPLLRLVDKSLQSRYEELMGQSLTGNFQLEQYKTELRRGGQTDSQAIQLSHRIEQQKIALQAITDQLQILKSQIDGLTITARRDAKVTSWDLRNQLSGRPVSAGQLVVTTVGPGSPSQLRLTIPERQLGRLRQAMARSREGLLVQFSLSSQPGEVQQGRLVSLSDQLVKDDDGIAKAIAIVAIGGHGLPASADGTIARATVVCGRTCAGWLAIRDAYREASAWWKLNW